MAASNSLRNQRGVKIGVFSPIFRINQNPYKAGVAKSGRFPQVFLAISPILELMKNTNIFRINENLPFDLLRFGAPDSSIGEACPLGKVFSSSSILGAHNCGFIHTSPYCLDKSPLGSNLCIFSWVLDSSSGYGQ